MCFSLQGPAPEATKSGSGGAAVDNVFWRKLRQVDQESVDEQGVPLPSGLLWHECRRFLCHFDAPQPLRPEILSGECQFTLNKQRTEEQCDHSLLDCRVGR